MTDQDQYDSTAAGVLPVVEYIGWAVIPVGERYRGVCKCGWSTADTSHPGFAEQRVRDHRKDRHDA